jgi:arginase family enzyme
MRNTGEHPSVRTIFAPYDSGHRGLRMGAGPAYLMEGGLPEMLRSTERPSLSLAHVLSEVDPPAQVATAFELDRLVSEQVREAVAGGEFSLVLSGNCNTAVGTIAGLDASDLGVVWFDAHVDFNTQETTTTGFTDGMGLAVAVGSIAGKRWPGACPAPALRPASPPTIRPSTLTGASSPSRSHARGCSSPGEVRRLGIGQGSLSSLQKGVSRKYPQISADSQPILSPLSYGAVSYLGYKSSTG